MTQVEQVADGHATEQFVRQVYDQAAALMRSGASEGEVRQRIIGMGLDDETAGMVINNLATARATGLRKVGQKNMLYGGLWCVGGTVVTVATYSAATGGGHYVVAWGAIVFGGIQFFRGVAQATNRR